VLGQTGANILEVSHRRLFLDTPAKGTKLDVTVETRDESHVAEIMAVLARQGWPATRMVGGAGDVM
jgi:threonine dehydratase